MPASFLVNRENCKFIDYIYPGELAYLKLGADAVHSHVVLIICDPRDRAANVYKARLPIGMNSIDGGQLEAMFSDENLLAVASEEATTLSVEAPTGDTMQLDVTHFGSMCRN